jgi:amino acid adenylation domain-containing protein
VNTLEVPHIEKNVLEAFKLAYILSNFSEKLDHLHLEIQNISQQFPDRNAIIHGDKKVSYQELESLSNQIANNLIKNKTNSEFSVGISLKESPLIPICILAVLKSGGTYVPLSLDYPKKRIEQIALDANIQFFITDAESDLDFDCQILRLNQDCSQVSEESENSPKIEIANNHPAYIMFTSGSTGKPKGVVIEHRSLSSYLEWYLSDLQSVSKINLPLTSSICFAASITQLFSALLLGKTLHIIDRTCVKSPKELFSWYNNHANFGLYCVPTLWEEMLNYLESNPSENQLEPTCLYLSGETLSKELVDRTFELFPEIAIWNLYGPTEATANISVASIKKGEDIHLGRPIRGGNFYILDEKLSRVPDGEEGFVYITSRALSRGYVNRQDLNESHFISEHELIHFEGMKLYNTGDRGKVNAQNELLFLGRTDQQVKIRGHRIELAEIEDKLKKHPSIRQATCKLISSKSPYIVAFIVAKNDVHSNEIRSYLLEFLPEYMIPEQFVFLDEMPKLPNGKINKQILF